MATLVYKVALNHQNQNDYDSNQLNYDILGQHQHLLHPMTMFSDKYKIINQIGQGATSKVYLIQQRCSNVKFAAKFIKRNENTAELIANSSQFICLQSFQQFKWVPKVKQVLREKGVQIIVMENLVGGTLDQAFSCNGCTLFKVTESSMIQQMKQLLSALMQIHRKGYTHGDIKPANIMYRSRNDPVMIDFGATNNRNGTAGYTAPELLKKSSNKLSIPTAQSDIYSLGAVFYLMCTGQALFKGSSVEEIIAKNRYQNKVEFPSQVNSQLKLLIQTMLNRNPQIRLNAVDLLEFNVFKQFNTSLPQKKIRKYISSLSF